jgi:hypothetical protein
LLPRDAPSACRYLVHVAGLRRAVCDRRARAHLCAASRRFIPTLAEVRFRFYRALHADGTSIASPFAMETDRKTETVQPTEGEIAPPEVEDWAKRLGISARRLRELILRAGPRVDDVKRALRKESES